MESITNFTQLTSHLQSRGVRKRIAVVCANDASTLEAARRAEDAGFAECIFFDGDGAATDAVQLVREGGADILMKGLVSTDTLLHAVLHKETGILPRGRVLTHIACAKLPSYPKLLFFSDAAVIPYPSQEQRRAQVAYMAQLCRNFGIEEPRISLVHCSEKVNEKFFPHTVGYLDLKAEAAAGDFGKCIVDGPLDVKTSLCAESLRVKGIDSPIGGEADALIFPDIEAGNAFYKTLTLFCDAEMACTLQGPLAPVVLPSRADSTETKYLSLALACLA